MTLQSGEKHDPKGYMLPTVHCSTVYNSKDMEATKYTSMDEWIKKIWYIYTMEYYSAIKKNETMPFASIWIDLEGVLLSEVSQTEKEKYRMTSLYVEPKTK